MKITTVIITLTLFFSISVLAVPAQVLIIRHGERPDTGNNLSIRGWARPHALVHYFETNPAVTQHGTPVAIYASRPGSVDPSEREIETVTPLSQAIHVRINATYEEDNYTPMVKEIMNTPQYDGKMVLICWEHRMINDLAAAFGVRPKLRSGPIRFLTACGKLIFRLVT